jgi:hypothetical protein
MRVRFKALGLLCSLFLATESDAFSLLGPLAPWMNPFTGFVESPSFDVGGPRNLGDEFRWNVSVLTYGYDPEFLAFFGTNGVVAVDGAVAILNAVEPASQIDLLKKAAQTRRVNITATQQSLFDLRSMALIYLTEQLGLANAVRFTWTVNSSNTPFGTEDTLGIPPYVLQRNFDPLTLAASAYVNGIRYTYRIESLPISDYPMLRSGNRICDNVLVDQTQVSYSGSSASFISTYAKEAIRPWQFGDFLPSLTRDDFGGIKYLLDTNNVNVEPIVTGSQPVQTGAQLIDYGLRRGVDKISFLRFDPGGAPRTNVFTDFVFSNGAWQTQIVQRIVTSPDVLFSASQHPAEIGTPPVAVRRTGPNYSHTNDTGNGILNPGVTISFHKFGDIFSDVWWTDGTNILEPRWGSFDGRTINPLIFPAGPKYQGGRTISLRTQVVSGHRAVEWKMRLIAGVDYAIEVSTNLSNWGPVSIVSGLPIHSITNVVAVDGSPTFWRARRISGE